MIFPVLRKSIKNLEEKQFYGIALMYLSAIGYKELSIVDGTGDGGRDVICSNKSLRIQLSVRKDWDNKINEEADVTLASGEAHLIYVTQKDISQRDEQNFLSRRLRQRGKVTVSIHDLNRIATTLSLPGNISSAYEVLGMRLSATIAAGPKEVALSSLLIFGIEAQNLRDNVIEANVKAILFKQPITKEAEVVHSVEQMLPGASVRKNILAAISRLRTRSDIVGTLDGLRLSREQTEEMRAAETEYNISFQEDIKSIKLATSLNDADSTELLNKALELLIRKRGLEGKGHYEEDLQRFISEKSLQHRKKKVYDCLSQTVSAKRLSFGDMVEHAFSANTFDIYRVLGGRTDLTMLLDTSVALPLIFSLEFSPARSRYGVAAAALKRICSEHNIKLVVPRPYLNEMASHGLRAVEHIETYPLLPVELKNALRASGNAYLSHYSFIVDEIDADEEKFSLKEFLSHFGILKGKGLRTIENRIESILDAQGILVSQAVKAKASIKKAIAHRKPGEVDIIIDHDASVCTMISDSSDKGFVLATWDNIIIEFVEELSRVYADTPAKIIDHLSMIVGVDFEQETNVEMLSSLLYIDEGISRRFAEQVERIRNTDQVFRLRSYVNKMRERKGAEWTLTSSDMTRFLDEDGKISLSDAVENGNVAS